MSWTRTKATGSGELRWRISFEGYPVEFVSHAGMVQTASDGRQRKIGLRSDSFRVSEKVDLIRAKWEADGFRVTIADINNGASDVFAKRPSVVSYLTTDATDTNTSIVTTSSAAWPASGQLYLNTETVEYSSQTGGTFTVAATRTGGGGTGRGVWESLAQYSYTTDGERSRYPEVTDWPVILEGRRARIYVYGAGDSATGDGTQVWKGIVSTEPSSNGQDWTFQLDSVARILDSDVGADLEDPVRLRGIYYPAVSPLRIRIQELDGNNKGDIFLADHQFIIAGFWESNAAFVIDLTAEISAQMTAHGTFTQTVHAVEDGDSWALRYETAANPDHNYMVLTGLSAVDGINGNEPFMHENAATGAAVEDTVSASTAYVWRQTDSALGTVPRAVFGSFPIGRRLFEGLPDAAKKDIDSSTFPPYRLYLGGVTGITANTTYVAVEWESTGYLADAAGFAPFSTAVSAVDTSNRHLTLIRPRAVSSGSLGSEWYSCVSRAVPTVRMGRDYGVGNLGTFLTTLEGDAAEYMNTGAVPYIRPTTVSPAVLGDFDITNSEFDEAETSPLTNRRGYAVFSEVSLGDIIEQDSRLAGIYPSLNSSGQIVFRKLKLPAQSEVNSGALTTTNIIVDEQWYDLEKGALGLFNTWVYRGGYDPIDDSYKGDIFKVRDLAAFGQSPNARVVEVKPYSSDPPGGVDFQDVVNAAQRALGVFGSVYWYLSAEVPFTLFDTLVGDVVSITFNKLPDVDGTLGVTNKIGMVVGREWKFSDSMGTLTILYTDQRVAGYSPASKISAIAGTSGTTGPFTLTVSGDYFPGTTTAVDHWSSGDLVRLVQWDSTTTANNVTATLDSDPVGTSVVVTADSNWTHTGVTWMVGSQISTSLTVAAQKLYAMTADSAALVDFSGDLDNPAFTLAV